MNGYALFDKHCEGNCSERSMKQKSWGGGGGGLGMMRWAGWPDELGGGPTQPPAWLEQGRPEKPCLTMDSAVQKRGASLYIIFICILSIE